MTEDEAQSWIEHRFGQNGFDRMMLLAELVRAESFRQNLVATSTLTTIWTRHIVDSAQLIGLAPTKPGVWLDIGSGAGFPGLVVAALTTAFRVVLIEPRRRRAEFLSDAAVALGVGNCAEIVCASVESIAVPADIISARAVASMSELFDRAGECSSDETQWLLPRGRRAREEVASARHSWHGVFHVERSVTDPDSLIVLASGVKRR